MSSANLPLPYSALKTGDYDEPGEIEYSEMMRTLRRSRTDEELKDLSDSIERLGQVSLSLAGEIELQDREVGELEEEVEGMEHDAGIFQRAAEQSERREELMNRALVVFIAIVLVIAITVLIRKEINKQS